MNSSILICSVYLFFFVFGGFRVIEWANRPENNESCLKKTVHYRIPIHFHSYILYKYSMYYCYLISKCCRKNLNRKLSVYNTEPREEKTNPEKFWFSIVHSHVFGEDFSRFIKFSRAGIMVVYKFIGFKQLPPKSHLFMCNSIFLDFRLLFRKD